MVPVEHWTIAAHLVGSAFAGGLIGAERSYHGRPAGFRTHTLVCLASSLLMLFALYQWQWLPGVPMETVRTDPTRMAQGIMTGIGFLGAGVIFREGLSVRGLTTAASIWITAAIGILIGVGFYFAAFMATALALGTLSVFRWVERKIPSHYYAHLHIRFHREAPMAEAELCAMLHEHGFDVANLSYRVIGEGKYFEYRMVIRSDDGAKSRRLAQTLLERASVIEYRISPAGD